MASYVVSWQRPDGQPGWHPAATVQEATAHVEHLRNHEGVDGARIYRLEEVPFELRPYFRVELAPAPAPAPAVRATSFAASITPEPPAVEPTPVDETDATPSWSAAEVDDEPHAANGTARRGLFGR